MYMDEVSVVLNTDNLVEVAQWLEDKHYRVTILEGRRPGLLFQAASYHSDSGRLFERSNPVKMVVPGDLLKYDHGVVRILTTYRDTIAKAS